MVAGNFFQQDNGVRIAIAGWLEMSESYISLLLCVLFYSFLLTHPLRLVSLEKQNQVLHGEDFLFGWHLNLTDQVSYFLLGSLFKQQPFMCYGARKSRIDLPLKHVYMT